MQRRAVLTVIVLALAGCTSSEEKTLQGTGEVVSWAELDHMTSQEVMMKVMRPASNKNWKGLKTAMESNPEFQEALNKFDKSSIPGKFSTPARETNKKDAVKHFQALIDGAKSGATDKELADSYNAAQKAMTDLTFVPGPEPKK
jgi:hydrogenase maturation factor